MTPYRSRSGSSPQTGLAATPHRDILEGRTLGGRYRILSLIAQGGMGRVYHAIEEDAQREVALKLLSPFRSEDEEGTVTAQKRFMREGHVYSQLNHPNTVTMYDFGVLEDNIFYIAMEYLKGRTLGSELKRLGRLEPLRMVRVTIQVCQSLEEAHKLGIIHRDVKPGNIILEQRNGGLDFVKVLDFGLVKSLENEWEEITQMGMVPGSPPYMAPEQILEQPLDARTDIYGVGIMMYRALTGRYPFRKRSTMHTLLAHLKETPPPFQQVAPDLTDLEKLERIVMRCLAKKPEERYSNMRQLLRALEGVVSELADAPEKSATPPTAPRNTIPATSPDTTILLHPSRYRRHLPRWFTSLVSGAGLLLLVTGLGYLFLG